MKKRGRINRAKRLVAQPKFRARLQKPAKGMGAYTRRRKHRQETDDA